MLAKFKQSPDVAAALFSSGTYKAFARKNWQKNFFGTLRGAQILKRDLQGLLVKDVYDVAYQALLTGYRCEYVYKNTLARKILLERHSLSEATLLGEFSAADAKVDLTIINGTSTAYEIKTAYDRLDRLSSQIHSYSQVFDQIFVVTDFSTIEGVKKIVPGYVGILELTNDAELKTHRKAVSNKKNISPASMFWSLRESEYTKIVSDYLGIALNLPNTERAAAYHKLFSSLSPLVAHQGFVSALRSRVMSQAQRDLIDSSPESLKYLSISKKFSKRDMNSIRLAMGEVL